jgi:hypothetical protein
MMASFEAASSFEAIPRLDSDEDEDNDDSSVGPKKPKRKKRFNEKLAALRRKEKKLQQASKKKDDENSDSGSECEVKATDVYGPCFNRKLDALHKQKNLTLKKAHSPDKKDDEDTKDEVSNSK